MLPGRKTISSNGFTFDLFEGDHATAVLSSGETWETHFLRLSEIFVKRGMSVLDAGAHFGYNTLQVSRLVGAMGTVIALEPQRIIFQQLCHHLFHNQIYNVTALPFAVLDRETKISISSFEETDARNRGVTSIGSGSEQTRSVSIDALGEFDFLKLDIQGSELAALRGAERCLEKKRPIIFIELEENFLRQQGASSKEVIEFLFARKFGLKRIETEWPADHLAYPLERKEEVDDYLRGFPWRLSTLEGKSVELTFGDSPLYESFKVR